MERFASARPAAFDSTRLAFVSLAALGLAAVVRLVSSRLWQAPSICQQPITARSEFDMNDNLSSHPARPLNTPSPSPSPWPPSNFQTPPRPNKQQCNAIANWQTYGEGSRLRNKRSLSRKRSNGRRIRWTRDERSGLIRLVGSGVDGHDGGRGGEGDDGGEGLHCLIS